MSAGRVDDHLLADSKSRHPNRAVRALLALAAHPEGITTPQIATLTREHTQPRQQALTRIGNVLRYHARTGHVQRTGYTTGHQRQGREAIWQLTQDGARWLFDATLINLRAAQTLEEIKARGAEGRAAVKAVACWVLEKQRGGDALSDLLTEALAEKRQRKPGGRVVIEMYTYGSNDPEEIRELSVGDKFEDLSDQWSWFKICGIQAASKEGSP